MDLALRVNIDPFCSRVVVLLFAGLQNKEDRKKLDYLLFVCMLALVCIELFADSAMLLTNGNSTKLGQGILRNATFLFFAVNPFITMISTPSMLNW